MSDKPTVTPPPPAVQEQPLTQQQALRLVGWVQPVDYAILGIVSLVWITLGYWALFAEPTPLQILSCCLVAFTLVQLWMVILLFRCSHFVLMLTAYVNTMPDAAARMVVSYYSGRPPAPQQPTK